ncbi:MAG: hypothetical protein ACK4SY_09245 [Pyrobaculum sp.]
MSFVLMGKGGSCVRQVLWFEVAMFSIFVQEVQGVYNGCGVSLLTYIFVNADIYKAS